MKSITLFTEEIDDIDLAMEELAEYLEEKNFTFLKNTCGIAFCDSEVEVEELLDAFGETFDFPIMGCTSLATLTKREGYKVSGISLLVLTADDCQFHMGMTEGFTDDTIEEKLQKAYEEVSKDLPEKEKLIIMYGSKALERGGDVYVDTLTELSGGVPVFGALASDHFTFKEYKVFCGKKAEHMGIAMLFITGNVKPIFRSEFSLNHLTQFSAEITSSDGCFVYTLDGKPFIDMMEGAGLIPRGTDYANVIMEFIGTPFLIEEEKENGEKVQKVRNLTAINKEDNSGCFLGNMEQGATMHVGLIRKDDVEISVRRAFEKVLEEIEASDYSYSTLLCSTCGSRYLVLAADPDAEAKAYKDKLPDNVDLSAFYSYGEIVPQLMNSGAVYNCFHNDTFTIMAI